MKGIYDILIAGAGASGLFCAMEAASPGRRILLLEKQETPARKLLMSGGGKANFSNLSVDVADYIGENPAFAAPALKAFPPGRFLALLEKHGIPVEEREFGQLFCRRDARDILGMFASACVEPACRLVREQAVTDAAFEGDSFRVRTGEKEYRAKKLVLACGSPAWPSSGADDSGLRLARSFGHRIIPPRPVLAPLALPADSPLLGLAGIAVPVTVRCAVPVSPSFTCPLLFTHKGLSGPAALQISCFWRKGVALDIDFLPGENLDALLDAKESGKMTPKSLLARRLPERLAAALLQTLPQPGTAARKCAELSRARRGEIHDAVHRHTVIPLRSEGLARAEACSGGVDTAGVDPVSMQSLRVPGLYFCGEILDIAGRLGGYNLHWAWASAHAVARSLHA